MYKRLSSILILLICIADSNVSAQKKLEVLFLGNSYTAVNGLPLLCKRIALSKGDSLITDENTPGGYTLQGHSTNTTSISKINSRPWDYVILQEQSQRPAFSQSQVAVEVYPFADSLNKYIKNNDSCTQTVFYMTWGRKNGDASNCASYPPICTYEGMQAGLRYSYLHMGQTLNAVVSPVGVVWKRVRNEGDSIDLYNADESHPSLAGSYLAACTFYATLFQKSPIGASYIPVGLNAATAIHLQQYAHLIVFDSLSVWNIDTTKVKADFSANLNQNIISITNNSQNATSYFWDFGDGQSQSGNAISHTYSSVGDYTLKLIAFKDCATDTMTQIIHVTVVGLDNREPNSIILELYPIPAVDFLNIKLPENMGINNYSVFNSMGCMILAGKIAGDYKIDITSLQNGMYYIRISTDQKNYSGKFQVMK